MSKHSSSGSEGGSRKGNKDKAEDDKLHMESASQADTSDDSIGEPSAKSSKSEVNSVPGTATKKDATQNPKKIQPRSKKFPLPERGSGVEKPRIKSYPTGRPLKKFSDPLKPQGNRTQAVIDEEERYKYQMQMKKEMDLKTVRGPSKKWENFPRGDRLTRQGLNPAKSMADVSSKTQKYAALQQGISHAKSTMNLRGSNATDEDSNAPLTRKKRCSTQVDVSGITSHGASLRAKDDPYMVKQKQKLADSFAPKKILQMPCGPLPDARRARIPADQLTAQNIADRKRIQDYQNRKLGIQICDKLASTAKNSGKCPTPPARLPDAEKFSLRTSPPALSVSPKPPLVSVLFDKGTDTPDPKDFIEPPNLTPKKATRSSEQILLVPTTPPTVAKKKPVSATLNLVNQLMDRVNDSGSALQNRTWGPTIKVPSKFASVKVPDRIKKQRDDWNKGAFLLDSEEVLINNNNEVLLAHMMAAAIAAVSRGMQLSQMTSRVETLDSFNEDGSVANPRDIIRYEQSDRPLIPAMNQLIPNIMRNFADQIGSNRKIPSLPIRNPPLPEDELPEIIQRREVRCNPLIEIGGQSLVGRNRTQLWGAVFNIPLTFGDGVAVLSSLYTDSIIDVLGVITAQRIEYERLTLHPNNPRQVFINNHLHQMIEAGQFNAENLQHLIAEIRHHAASIGRILVPINNMEPGNTGSGHWTLGIISMQEHTIGIFDPLQGGRTYGSYVGTNATSRSSGRGNVVKKVSGAVTRTMRSMEQLRLFMAHIFPNDHAWNSPYPGWPRNETGFRIHNIMPQDNNYDCGPIVTLAMEFLSGYWDTLSEYDIEQRRENAERGMWWQVRLRNFMLIRRLLEGSPDTSIIPNDPLLTNVKDGAEAVEDNRLEDGDDDDSDGTGN